MNYWSAWTLKCSHFSALLDDDLLRSLPFPLFHVLMAVIFLPVEISFSFMVFAPHDTCLSRTANTAIIVIVLLSLSLAAATATKALFPATISQKPRYWPLGVCVPVCVRITSAISALNVYVCAQIHYNF